MVLDLKMNEGEGVSCYYLSSLFFILGAKLIVGLVLVGQLMIGLWCVPCLPPLSVGVSFFVHSLNQQEWAPCIPIYKQREWDKKKKKKIKKEKKKTSCKQTREGRQKKGSKSKQNTPKDAGCTMRSLTRRNHET
jgi:hypothetical protein